MSSNHPRLSLLTHKCIHKDKPVLLYLSLTCTHRSAPPGAAADAATPDTLGNGDTPLTAPTHEASPAPMAAAAAVGVTVGGAGIAGASVVGESQTDLESSQIETGE